MTKRGKKIWVGFDLGGTKMMATVYDDRFRAQVRHLSHSKMFFQAMQ